MNAEGDLISGSNIKKALVNDIPELVQRYPIIDNYLTNLINTNPGIQVPALIHSLTEIFGKDGLDQSVFSDESFLQWVNGKLMEKQMIPERISPQIGLGVGTQIENAGDRDPNKDPFILLVPNNSF